MRTPASIAQDQIHPMLIPLPIGLWVFSFICDLIFVFGRRARAEDRGALHDVGAGSNKAVWLSLVVLALH